MDTPVNKDPWDALKEMDFTKNSFQDIGNGILLTNHEIDVLKKYHIPYQTCHSLKEILFYIEEELEFAEEDLEEIEIMISERDYYQNTNQ